jgi:protein CpxP
MKYIREVKMKKFSKIQSIAMAFVMAIAVAVPVAIAQSTGEGDKVKKEHRGHKGMRGAGMRGGRMMGFRNLDLTDAQKAQMKQIRENHRQAIAPLREQIRAKHQEMRQANQGGTFNEALAAQKLAELAPLQAKLQAEQFRLRQEMLSVLTPEQKTKLEQQREQFKTRRNERRANKQPRT